MKKLKDERMNYTVDINAFDFKEAINNLLSIYGLTGHISRDMLRDLFSEITQILVSGRGSKSHKQLADILEEFWNTKKIISENIDGIALTGRVLKVKTIILELFLQYSEEENIMNALVSLLRVPEFFYISHEELSNIQSEWEKDIDQVTMLSNIKSIFKNGNKDTEFLDLIKLNENEIRQHCGIYDPNLVPSFVNYLQNRRFKHTRVKLYMERIFTELDMVLKEIKEGAFPHFHTKNTSSFMGEYSMIADNFLEPADHIIPKEQVEKYLNYPRLETDINCNYLKLGFGLGPDFKLRNIVFACAFYQNYCAPIRIAAKRVDKWFRKQGIINPNRTDSQVEDFLCMVNNNSCAKYKVNYDLSKYSDYLLAWITDTVMKMISSDPEYADTVNKIMRLPIGKNDLLYPILFGTGAGVKGNFDLITISHILIDDFSSYYYNYDVQNMNFVSDDNYSDSESPLISNSLKIVYTHLNCKLNTKKSAAVIDIGKVSFCNRHFWYEHGTFSTWNGIPPGLWMKEIYSFTRLNSMLKLMKETNQSNTYDCVKRIYLRSKPKIEREFKINNSKANVDQVWEELQNVPYLLNGFSDFEEEETGSVAKWAVDIYYNLDQYIFHMKNNETVSMILEKYDRAFPDHPIFDVLCFRNTEYLEIIQNIEEAFDWLVFDPNVNNHRHFLNCARKAILRFSKIDKESNRISTKDRTSDYYNEDRFVSRNYKEVINYATQRMTREEIEVFSTSNSKYPTSEMYLKLVNGLIRNGRAWMYDSNSFVAMSKSFKNSYGEYITVRLYSEDRKLRNKNATRIYEDYNYSNENSVFIFDSIYPNNNQTRDYKVRSVAELCDLIYKLKTKSINNIAKMLEII